MGRRDFKDTGDRRATVAHHLPTPLPGGAVRVPRVSASLLTVEVRVCVLTLAGTVCLAITNHHEVARLWDACLLTHWLAHSPTYLLTHSLTCKHDMGDTLTRPLPDMSIEMNTQQAVYGHEQHTPSTQMQTRPDTDKEAVNGTVMKHYHSAPWQRLLLCFAYESVLTHLSTHLHSYYLLTHLLTYSPVSYTHLTLPTKRIV